MSTVIAELYELLKNNETGLYRNRNKEIVGYVHIDFWDLEKLVKVLGEDYFLEGGLEVQMFSNSICVEINNIIEGYGHDLKDYKNCFYEHDWKNYFEE